MDEIRLLRSEVSRLILVLICFDTWLCLVGICKSMQSKCGSIVDTCSTMQAFWWHIAFDHEWVCSSALSLSSVLGLHFTAKGVAMDEIPAPQGYFTHASQAVLLFSDMRRGWLSNLSMQHLAEWIDENPLLPGTLESSGRVWQGYGWSSLLTLSESELQTEKLQRSCSWHHII